MKFIHGTASGFSGTLVGRVTFKKKIFGNADKILVCKEAPSRSSGLTAVIANTASRDVSYPLCLAEGTDILNEGDVVFLNDNGDVTVAFDSGSKHNSIMLTERCNHRCIMCPQPPKNKKDDLTAYNLKLIDLINSHPAELGITGGEPTLVGDDLFKIIQKCRDKLPHTALTLLTNGVKFADQKFAEKLYQCRHPDLLIDVPFFSDVAVLHNEIVGAKTFYKTVRGLYNLALYDLNIGIRIVVHKMTFNRLPQLAEYIYRNFPFVSHVAFMQMENSGLVNDNFDRLWIDPYDYNQQLREAVLILVDRDIEVNIYNSQLCILPEDIRQYAVQSISDWKDIYIEQCRDCSRRGECPGFFASNKNSHSRHIKSFQL